MFQIYGRPIWIWLIAGIYAVSVVIAAFTWMPVFFPANVSLGGDYRPVPPNLVQAEYYGFRIKYMLAYLAVFGTTLRLVAIYFLLSKRYLFAAALVLLITLLNVINDGNSIYMLSRYGLFDQRNGSFAADLLPIVMAVIAVSAIFGTVVLLYLRKLARQDRSVATVFE